MNHDNWFDKLNHGSLSPISFSSLCGSIFWLICFNYFLDSSSTPPPSPPPKKKAKKKKEIGTENVPYYYYDQINSNTRSCTAAAHVVFAIAVIKGILLRVKIKLVYVCVHTHKLFFYVGVSWKVHRL